MPAESLRVSACIANVTHGVVLADRAAIAHTWWRRLRGLLARRRLHEGEGLIFPRCRSIHTGFMPFPIDVIFAKSDGPPTAGAARSVSVTTFVERLKPFRVVWDRNADTVIELPANTISRTSTQRGTRLTITHPTTPSTSPPIAPHTSHSIGAARLPPSLPVFYLTVLGCLGFFYLIRWPIMAGDTDLWYHLAGGRYLFATHTIPHDSFFSFLSPPRAWVDYSWLFQAVVYLVYSWLGYHGLVVFRTGLYVAALTVIFRYLFHGRIRQPLAAWWTFLVIACGSILLPRYLLVRPHMMTLVFIITFLYILEFKPQRAIALPGLAILWSNLHGIAYPVLWLICGSYLLEEIWVRVKGPTSSRQITSCVVPLAVSMLAVFLTPHGIRLFGRPLISTASASEYIQELAPLSLPDVFSAHLSMMTPSPFTMFNLFLLIACLAALASLRNTPFRISHWLLCLGGGVLLAKGLRFMSEFSLLALPLLKANPPFPPGLFAGKVSRPVYLAGLFLVMLVPVMLVVSAFAQRPAYPFSHRDLPQGVVTFLNHVKSGGSVLNHPNTGGYLQWMLYPRYRIFMDMEVPFLFRDEDLYIAQHVFSDEEVLRKVLWRYHPSFLTVPNTAKEFPTLLKHFPEYVLVCVDDVEVLYVNQDRHPELAKRYQLHALDPFVFSEQSVETVLDGMEDLAPLMREARQLLELYPDGKAINRLAALIFQRDHAYDRMLPHAEAIVRNFPESPVGYRLKAEALAGLKQFDQAITTYLAAIERSAPSEQIRLYKEIGVAYLEQHQYARAYTALNRSIGVFSAKTTIEDLYHLGFSASMAGKPRQARQILTYLYEYKLSPHDTEWLEKVKRDLTRLDEHASQ